MWTGPVSGPKWTTTTKLLPTEISTTKSSPEILVPFDEIIPTLSSFL